MEAYTDPENILAQISALLENENPADWRIGVGLIKSIGNPLEHGVECMYTYHCSPKITLQLIDRVVKQYGVLKDSCWTYPELNNSELVLYRRKPMKMAS